jgi:hypothetical protein
MRKGRGGPLNSPRAFIFINITWHAVQPDAPVARPAPPARADSDRPLGRVLPAAVGVGQFAVTEATINRAWFGSTQAPTIGFKATRKPSGEAADPALHVARYLHYRRGVYAAPRNALSPAR